MVAVTCDIAYEYVLDVAARGGGRKTSAALSLSLEARELTTGKSLFQQALAELSRYEGQLKWSGQQRVQFDAEISANTRWQVLLRGQAKGDTGPTGETQVRLHVKGCEMTVAERARPQPQQ